MKNQNKILFILVLLAIGVSFSFKSFDKKKLILIDAGHGGKDFGAIKGDQQEKRIAEIISNKIKALHLNDAFEIQLLRSEDEFISLADRVEKINSYAPDLLISIHVNSSKDPLRNGMEIFVSKQNTFYQKSLMHANLLMSEISHEETYKTSLLESNLYVLKNSNCPAILLELGYLSNEADLLYITSSKGQDEIATRIYSYLGKD